MNSKEQSLKSCQKMRNRNHKKPQASIACFYSVLPHVNKAKIPYIFKYSYILLKFKNFPTFPWLEKMSLIFPGILVQMGTLSIINYDILHNATHTLWRVWLQLRLEDEDNL